METESRSEIGTRIDPSAERPRAKKIYDYQRERDVIRTQLARHERQIKELREAVSAIMLVLRDAGIMEFDDSTH